MVSDTMLGPVRCYCLLFVGYADDEMSDASMDREDGGRSLACEDGGRRVEDGRTQWAAEDGTLRGATVHVSRSQCPIAVLVNPLQRKSQPTVSFFHRTTSPCVHTKTLLQE